MYTHHIIMLVAHFSYLHPIVAHRTAEREAAIVELAEQWRDCIAAFLRSFSRSNSENSATYYRTTLRYFFVTLQRDPAHCTRADVEDFMWRPAMQGYRNAGQRPAPGTRNVRLAVVASFYKFASDYVPAGQYEPLFAGRLPTQGIVTAKRTQQYRAMSLDEVSRFLAVIDRDSLIGKRDYSLFLAYYVLARRLRELADLRYGDITWQTIVDSGERRGAWIYAFRGKGKKLQIDHAEMPQVVKDAIDEYLQASGRLPLAPDDPVWFAVEPNAMYDPFTPLSSSAIQRRMKKYCGYAGLDVRRLTVHSWRHASVQHRYESGEDIRSIQHLLRHSSLDTTSIYLHGLISEADPWAQALIDRLDL